MTLEANPGTIERGRFAEYRAAGVNRVSLGAQSFDDARLAALGRIHCADETRRAAAELHAAGVANFNIDLMYGLPGQDVDAALRDVEEALALRPSHLSHYQLTIEAGTVFAGRPPILPDDDAADAMLDACRERLEQTGFAQYEVSAYAAAERRCRHNLNYWSFGDYLGIGAGAHGKLSLADQGQVVRTTQVREPRRYLSSAGRGTFTRAPVPAHELPFEFMLNALRLVEGFEVRTFTGRTGLPWASRCRYDGGAGRRGLDRHRGNVVPGEPARPAIPQRCPVTFCDGNPESRRSIGIVNRPAACGCACQAGFIHRHGRR